MSENEDRKKPIGVYYPGEGTRGSTLVLTGEDQERPKSRERLPQSVCIEPQETSKVIKTLDLLAIGAPNDCLGLAKLLQDPRRDSGYWRFDPDHKIASYQRYFYPSANDSARASAVQFNCGFNFEGSVEGVYFGGFFETERASIIAEAAITDGKNGVRFNSVSDRSLELPAMHMREMLLRLFDSMWLKNTAVAFVPAWLAFLGSWVCQPFFCSDERILGPLDGFQIELCEKASNESALRRGNVLRFGKNYLTHKEQMLAKHNSKGA